MYAYPILLTATSERLEFYTINKRWEIRRPSSKPKRPTLSSIPLTNSSTISILSITNFIAHTPGKEDSAPPFRQ